MEPALVTVGVTLLIVTPGRPDALPLKMLVASVAPTAIVPPVVMLPAAMKADEFLAIDPTLAASAAACSLLFSWFALV